MPFVKRTQSRAGDVSPDRASRTLGVVSPAPSARSINAFFSCLKRREVLRLLIASKQVIKQFRGSRRTSILMHGLCR